MTDVAALAGEIGSRGELIRNRIASVGGRDVRVVAVTKGHPPEVAMAASAAGYTDLGENYAQELISKDAAFAKAGLQRPHWHFIGRLQSNKIRQLVGIVELWQSVDRASLVAELARRAPGARILIQVDLAGLGGRGGCPPEEVGDLVRAAGDSGLRVEGLMGVGPPGDPEFSREPFRWLARTAGEQGLPEVSMGMSADLEVAVAEGSTMVRVGTALLGERADQE
jgi:pyridoxal phosphate enzyme (YggS family)